MYLIICTHVTDVFSDKAHMNVLGVLSKTSKFFCSKSGIVTKTKISFFEREFHVSSIMCVYQYLLFNNFLLYLNSVFKSVPGKHKVDKFCNIIKHGIIPFHFRLSYAMFIKFLGGLCFFLERLKMDYYQPFLLAFHLVK